MKIKLVSDFIEYYDHCFAPSHLDKYDYTLLRNSVTTMTRLEQFKILSNLFYVPIKHSIVKDYHIFDTKYNVIVYVDNYSHRGEGKLKMTYEEALDKYPNSLCSLYIQGNSEYATSFRELFIGNHQFKLRYINKNKDEWRSNYGEDVEVKLISHCEIYNKKCSRFIAGNIYPIYAVDFIQNTEGKLFYIDFNTSPSIKYTGIEDICKPTEIYNLIENYVQSYIKKG